MDHSVNSKHNDALIQAIQAGDVEMCCNLLKQGANPNARDPDSDFPALRLAMVDLQKLNKQSRFKIVMALIDAGANPDGSIVDKATPLISAACCGYLDVARVLVEAGADIHRESLGLPFTPTAAAEYYSFLGKGQAEVAKYLRSLGGQNPYNDPNRPDDQWDGCVGELHLRFVERALDSRVSPFPFKREHDDGRELLAYSCRFDRKKWLFRLLFTVQLSMVQRFEVGLVLPGSWPVHRAALELPRFAWPLDLLFGVAARLDRGEATFEHGDVLDRAHPAVRGLPWPALFDQWLVVQHTSFEAVRQELSTKDEFIRKWLKPTLLLVPHFEKKPLRPGQEALTKADAKATVKWAKPALGTKRNGLVVPIEASAEGLELRSAEE